MGQAKLRGTFEERKAQAIAAGIKPSPLHLLVLYKGVEKFHDLLHNK